MSLNIGRERFVEPMRHAKARTVAREGRGKVGESQARRDMDPIGPKRLQGLRGRMRAMSIRRRNPLVPNPNTGSSAAKSYLLPPPGLRTRADDRVVRDQIGLNAPRLHLLEQPNRVLGPTGLVSHTNNHFNLRFNSVHFQLGKDMRLRSNTEKLLPWRTR
jgi:hypothetical protein